MIFFSSFQRYWDWFPSEIQDYILSFVLWQSVRDQRNPLKENLFREISNYHALKVAWNHPPIARGRLQITHRRCIERCPNNINMHLNNHSLNCDGKSCTTNHSYIWGIHTVENMDNKKIGQYEVFLGHNFPETFRRVNASLAIVKRHMAGEITYNQTYSGIYWCFWPYPINGNARPTSRVIGIGYLPN